jgi:FGGY-family pentulose kinase
VRLPAAVFDLSGKRLGRAVVATKEWNDREDWHEQSSADVWVAAGQAVRGAVASAGIDAATVVGISFDATCSLVVLGTDDEPVTVSLSGDAQRNIIQWRDHRAMGQATRINNGAHDMLAYVGGIVSPEHEVPKLLWLKETLPDSWAAARKVLDLADFMVYASCGTDCRSLCTTVCKWAYLGHKREWDAACFDNIGIGDLLSRGLVASDIRPMGAFAGPLTAAAAEHFGLSTRTAVGVGIIDAHAGALGVGVSTSNMALILGTSSCHMICSASAAFVPGLWGPYYGAQREGEWLTEGGLSASGSLMDYVLLRYGHLRDEGGGEGEEGGGEYGGEGRARHLLDGGEGALERAHDYVNRQLEAVMGSMDAPWELAEKVHVLPHHHGNRSPFADPAATGVMEGETLDQSDAVLPRVYLATIQGLAYMTRHIVDQMRAQGLRVDTVSACGGSVKSAIYLQV